jgi:hypothetical protein
MSAGDLTGPEPGTFSIFNRSPMPYALINDLNHSNEHNHFHSIETLPNEQNDLLTYSNK